MRGLLLTFGALTATMVFAGNPQPKLINGSPANPNEWPASVYASMGGARCTATIVGERVLIIAAHCVSDSSRATFSVGPNNYQSRCTFSPQYQGNETADWALCLIDQKVEGIAYEVLNQDPNLFRVGDQLTLTGYGCVNPGGGGGNDGIYRIGQATVESLPSGSVNDIVTQGEAALCFGDSGGPAFFGSTESRSLVSINSRGDIQTRSFLVSVSTDAAKQFIQSWARSNGQKICGVHADAQGCRGRSPSVD